MKRYLGQPIYSRRDAENANEEAGFHFFEPGTMRFFRSRISEMSFTLCEKERVTYFVTSEQYRGMDGTQRPRRYTLRRIIWDTGDVATIGEFQGYASRASAQRAIPC